MTVGCLNGDSIVNTPTGPRQVKHISVGDKVLAKDPTTGALVYDDVVFTPHKDAASLTLYQDIKASVPANQESRQLQVTASHYVPVGKDGKESKLAKDVQVCTKCICVLHSTDTFAVLGINVSCATVLAAACATSTVRSFAAVCRYVGLSAGRPSILH